MSRQQAHVEQLLRSQHDKLVAEIRLRQRNIVFPDTVRNWGVFYRNLTSKSIYTYPRHRIFAFFWGLHLLMRSIFYVFGNIILMTMGYTALRRASWLGDIDFVLEWSLWAVVGLKVAVHAVIREDSVPRLRLAKTCPRVKI
jgi:hypothetical protein